MKLQANEIIKNLRTEWGLSQEEFAEKIKKSARQLSRIENGQADVHILELVDIMQKYGRPGQTNDLSSLALKSNSYRWYAVFRKALYALMTYDWAGVDAAITELEAGWKKDYPYIAMIKAYAQIRQREYMRRAPGSAEQYDKEDIKDLTAAISITHPGFDERKAGSYPLVGHEFYLLSDMALAIKQQGELDRAKNLYDALLSNKGLIARASDDNFQIDFYVQGGKMSIQRAMGNYNDVVVEGLNMINGFVKKDALINLGTRLSYLVYDYDSAGEDASILRLWALRAYSWAEFRGFANHIENMRVFLAEKCGSDVNWMPD
ncbi:MAG: helix-turn-helix domain-containing protein [Defluviitaleaceae bacterium]|nr:helix-turn-helix domain-containing protein [Defluviitaleaceae bacterium]